MNKDIQARWIANLESGKYPKASGTLKTSKGFCCLGVLTDMYAREYGKEWVRNEYDDPTIEGTSMTEFSLLADEVREWAGIADEDMHIHSIGPEGSLARLNDQSDTFDPVIARIKEL